MKQLISEKYACGTMKAKRIGIPHDLNIDKETKKGETDY